MTSIFEFMDYRLFLRSAFERLPRKGRGKSLELAKFLGIHPTVVSQVFSGLRDFTEEQSLEIAEFLNLSNIESRYFTLLVRTEIAGTAKLKKLLKAELESTRQAARSLSTRVATEKTLSDTERAVFYSTWLYSATRLYCSTSPGGRTADEVAEHFGVPRARALEICQFLARTGLCTMQKDRFLMGSQSTFVEKGSPFLLRHHSNWRLRAIQAGERLTEEELMFTGVMSISKNDFGKLRERMAAFISEFAKTVKDSPAEEVACFNMDFFRVER